MVSSVKVVRIMSKFSRAELMEVKMGVMILPVIIHFCDVTNSIAKQVEVISELPWPHLANAFVFTYTAN